MAGFDDVLTALYDLLDAQTDFKNHVSKFDYSKISEDGSTSIVLLPGGFTHEDETFGGTYAAVWEILVDIYEPYSNNIETDVTTLIKARDTIINLLEQKVYLGKGFGNSIGIEVADIIEGTRLAAVLAEDEVTVTHLVMSVLLRVRQQSSVTLET